MLHVERLFLTRRLTAALALGRRAPVFLSWSLTNRCNLRCRYCGVWSTESDELDTEGVLWRLNELADLGARFVGISGGEPTLRDDLGLIVDAFKDRRLSVMLQTNGLLLPDRIHELRRIDEVQISLDGPKEIHDSLRGRGSFDAAVAAVEACRRVGLKAQLLTVLSRRNLGHIDEVLDLADELGVGLRVQPVDPVHGWVASRSRAEASEVAMYRRTMDRLLEQKREGRWCIRNSTAVLRYLRQWPHPRPLSCRIGPLLCAVEPDGSVWSCSIRRDPASRRESGDGPIGAAVEAMPLPGRCKSCLSGGTLDVNLALNGHLSSLIGLTARFLSLGERGGRP